MTTTQGAIIDTVFSPGLIPGLGYELRAFTSHSFNDITLDKLPAKMNANP
jgi:hypothetical protein